MGTKRKRLFAIVAVILMIGAVSFFYWQYTTPKSIHTIYQDLDKVKQTFQNYKPGDEVPVTGKITAIEDFNTTGGPVRIVMLDGATRSEGIIVSPGSDYKVGDQFTTTLHFKQYRYNNDTIVSAKELFGPLPFLPLELSRIIHDVSVGYSGLVLLPERTNGNMLITVFATVFEPHGGYPLELLNLTLRKGKHFGPQDVADLTPGGWTEIDGKRITGDSTAYQVMDSMSALNMNSSNGMLEFLDGGNIGRLDGGDRFILKVPLPNEPNAYESYFLQLEARGMFELAQYVVVANDKPLRYVTEPSFLQIKPRSDVQDAKGRTLTLMVSCSVGQSLFPCYKYDWVLRDADSDTSSSGKLGDVIGDPSLRYSDANANGLLDYPDEMVIRNATPLKKYSITLATKLYSSKNWENSPTRGANWSYSLRWISGLGICPLSGCYAWMDSCQTSPGSFLVNVSQMYGEPGVSLAWGNIRVALSQNGSGILDDCPLVGGPMNGTGAVLNFTDADANGYINEGDFFTLTGRPGASYCLELKFGNGKLFQGKVDLNPS